MPIDTVIKMRLSIYMPSIILSNLFDYQAILDTEFSTYLIKQKASEITRKNYMTDIRNFFRWLNNCITTGIITLREDTEKPLRTITTDIIEAFKQAMITTKTPTATINRRLSALRTFFQFALIEQKVSENPTLLVRNISRVNEADATTTQQETVSKTVSELKIADSAYQALLDTEFSVYLTKQAASEITRKNYMTDIRNFFSWLTNSLKMGILSLRENKEKPLQSITSDVVERFKQALVTAKTPVATINRRLSALRMFFQFAFIEQKVLENPTLLVKNISRTDNTNNTSLLDKALTEYINDMHATTADIDDIRSFFSWYYEQYIS